MRRGLAPGGNAGSVFIRRWEMASIRQLARGAIINAARGFLFPSLGVPGTERGGSWPARGVPARGTGLRPPAATFPGRAMKILAIDIGGTNVKVKSTESEE